MSGNLRSKIKLSYNDYIATVRRPYPPFLASVIQTGAGNYGHYRAVINESFAIRGHVWLDSVCYYRESEIIRAGEIALHEWRHSRPLARAQQYFMNCEQTLYTAALSGDSCKYINSLESYMPALILVWACGDYVQKAICGRLEKHLSSDAVRPLMDKLNIPLQDNFYKQEEYDLVASKDINAHVQKYRWLRSRYGSLAPYTVKEAKTRLRHIDKSEFLQKRRREKEIVSRAVGRAKQILGSGDATLVDLMQYVVYYRTQRTDVINRSAFYFAPTLRRIGKEYGLSYGQSLYCLRDEIMSNRINPRYVAERYRDWALILDKGKVFCATGKAVCELRTKLVVPISQSVSEVKGTTAFAGKIRGLVRIISSAKNHALVKRGDIIVTSMTTPDMLPLMRKAAGFVTDEGGITCHAAIVAREMKKPCIIGTKIATQVFREGDLVEVDANKGVVRIIK